MRRACLILTFAATSAVAGVNRWTGIGPQNTIQTMAVDPRSAMVIYAAAYGTAWKSVDGGANWSSTQLGVFAGPIIRIAPSAPATIYIIGLGAMYTSTTSGVSWTRREIHSDVLNPNDLQVDAVQPNTLVEAELNFCFFGCSGGGVYRSTDAGANWRQIGLKDTNIYQVALDPRNAQMIYANGLDKLFRTANGGSSWQTITPPASGSIRMVTVDPFVSQLVYVVADAGVFKSSDSGRSWQLILQPGSDLQDVAAVAVDGSNGNHLVAAGTGAVESFDGGRTWTKVGSGIGNVSQIEIRGQSYIAFSGDRFDGIVVGYTFVPPRRRAVRD